MSNHSDTPQDALRAAEPPSIDILAMPRVLRRIFITAVLGAPYRVALAVGASFGSALASLALPTLLGRTIDLVRSLRSAHSGSSHQTFTAMGIFLIAALAARGGFTVVADYQAEWVSQRLALRLRLTFFEKVQQLTRSFHDETHSGDLITRGLLDLEGARLFVHDGMLAALVAVLQISVCACRMIALDPILAIVGLAFAPVATVRLVRSSIDLRTAWLTLHNQMGLLTQIMEENLQGARVVRSSAARQFEVAKFSMAAKMALASAFLRVDLRRGTLLFFQASFYVSVTALLWLGGRDISNGRITAGRLAEFVAYMPLLLSATYQVNAIVATAAKATASGKRLFEVIDSNRDLKDRPESDHITDAHCVLRFENVSFSYKPGVDVLHDICFEVSTGKTLGIVGPPGSGKSTIASLIPRFYDVTKGKITINSQDIRQLSLSSLRSYISIVPQDVFLFDTTIGANIAYGNPEATNTDVENAAQVAQIHSYINSLEQKYATGTGERGVKMSGGQRQRLSIARAILPGPGLIIFDDSSSAIDAVTEKNLRRQLAEVQSNKVTIIIGQRLTSLMHSDDIIFLDEGRVIERGNHEELMALGARYAALFALQAQASQRGHER